MNERFGVMRLPDHVHFGPGTRSSLVPAVRSLGTRALVIVDPFLAKTATFRELMATLVSSGVSVVQHEDVVPELPAASVEAAAAAAQSHHPDVVVGYGGGSALDLAKLVSLLLRHGGPLSGYYGENNVPGPVVPIVAVPTTAGTGSEVTPVAVVSDPARELKVGVSDPHLVPRVAIVDPELCLGAPATVTAYAGIDALVHALEAVTAIEVPQPDFSSQLPVFIGRNRMSSVLALEAIRSMAGALPQAVADGADLHAREQMSWGAMLAGMSFGSAGTHLSHALQYPIGALTKTPHGLGTGLMIPYVLQAGLRSTITQLGDIADALHLPPGTPEQRAQSAVDCVADLVAQIGIPNSLAEIGIQRDQLGRVAQLAAGVTRLAGNAPLTATPALLEQILRAAFNGDRKSLT